jgi:hypothetical protein
MNGVSRTILHLLPRFKRYVNYLLGYIRSKVQTLQMRTKDTEVEETETRQRGTMDVSHCGGICMASKQNKQDQYDSTLRR